MKTMSRTMIGGFLLAILVWPVATSGAEVAAKPIKTLERPEGDVFSIAFTADGNYVCAGGERGVVYCWDEATGEITNRITAHLRAAVFAVAAYPLAPFAVHASELGIKFHLVGGHGRVPTFPFKHMQTVLTVDFSKDGNHMASGDRGGETIVWDLWTGEPYRRFQAEKIAVNSVRYHMDGNRVATATEDGKVRVWDAKADRMLYEIAAHEGACYSAAFSPDGKWLATTGKDKKVKLWDAANGRAAGTLEGHTASANVALFHPGGGPMLVSAGDDNAERVWNFREKKLLQTIAHEKPVYALAWRPDGGMLATGSGTLVQLFEVK